MKNTIWEKRIPTLLGIFFILIGIGLTSLLVRQGIIFIGKAAPALSPKQVSVTNVTDSSLTVSYLTDENTVGSVNYGKDQKFGQIARDDRDQENNSLTPRKIHNITLRNLSPMTKYYFSITNGEENYLNGELPYNAQTGQVISEVPPEQVPISGKAITAKGTAPKEALIFASLDGSQKISTLLKGDGSYIIPLNSLRTADFSTYFDFSKPTITMEIIGDDFTKSVVITSIGQNPIPTVTLSKDYDFSLGSEPIATDSGEMQALSNLSTTQAEEENKVTIETPVENANFTDSRPIFSGTSTPNEKVTITINSDEPIEVTVTADSAGNWTYRPDQELPPGQHTITISSKDSTGATRFITRSFIVYASGTQIADATPPPPSISPSPPEVSPSPTLAPSPTPTVFPTATLAPSPTPTNAPTPSLSLSPTPIGSPTPTLAPPGSSSVTGFGILGMTIALFGVLLFLLSRGRVAL
ncbi:MAG: hypothetical protein A2W22_02625 [Candidatus Levybacteria bacterium RBG_16_35_11]|nr:MAG: hypothetical protein A2W22_02625 [Candidatus Levybacteria bacterium RBG_16_35_11]